MVAGQHYALPHFKFNHEKRELEYTNEDTTVKFVKGNTPGTISRLALKTGVENQKDGSQLNVFVDSNGEKYRVPQGIDSHSLTLKKDKMFYPIDIQVLDEDHIKVTVLDHYAEEGQAGITVESVITLAMHKVSLENTSMPCAQNEIVIQKLKESLMWLSDRETDRRNRQVLGTINP